MYAIAFDLLVHEADARHPRRNRGAYDEIGQVMRRHGFRRVQGSVYLSERSDLAAITFVMSELRELDWFAPVVRDIRAFKVEDWSDFTSFFKGSAA